MSGCVLYMEMKEFRKLFLSAGKMAISWSVLICFIICIALNLTSMAPIVQSLLSIPLM